MPDSKPVYIISDSPLKESNLFGFDAYAKTIAELIAYKENKTPLVIGIYGPWGSGKTTLMETVRSHLRDDNKLENREMFRKCKTVWFQAWKYKEEDEILAALIEEIFKTMNADGFFEQCKAEIEKLVNRFNKGKAAGFISKLVSGGLVDVSELFSELEYKEKIGFYDTFQDFFDRLLWDYINWRPKVCNNEKIDDTKGVLVIFIDDLDRCPEDKILKVLETIKLFMDKEGCIFVIAAHEIIEKTLKKTYIEDAGQFMEKIVQVTFNLPQITSNDLKSFVKGIEQINPALSEDDSPHIDVIIAATNNNPRRLKRFLNNLSLSHGLMINKGINIDFNHLMYWGIIELLHPALRNTLKDNVNVISLLRENFEKIEGKLSDKEAWDISDEMLKEVPQQSLHVYLKNKEVRKILSNFSITPEQLNQIITFTEVVGRVEEDKGKKDREAGIDLSRTADVPMVEIPEGLFLYGYDKHNENIEEPFLIDVYPVTNSQFRRFIEAGGYSDREILEKCWSDEGRNWRADNNITGSRYRNDEEWNQPDHPVVGVSYYEAEAYAKWADKRLPTEKEWEKAARGDDGNIYPWGNDFDKDKCNTSESGIGKTTRVTRYPNGISTYGCYDMAGNVWEWTSSDYESEGTKVLRGGSWGYGHGNARCAVRSRNSPDDRGNDVGFRCARTLK